MYVADGVGNRLSPNSGLKKPVSSGISRPWTYILFDRYPVQGLDGVIGECSQTIPKVASTQGCCGA